MKKHAWGILALRWLFAILGAFLLVFSILPMSFNRLNVGMLVGILLGLSLLILAFLWDTLGRLLRKILKSKLRIPVITFGLICGMGLALFAASVGLVVSGIYCREESSDTVIVLGCLVDGDKPSPLLRYRIESAADYLKRYPDSLCIVSGGKGNGENITESSCMKEELIKLGIDEQRIYEEDKSTNTKENIAFSAKIIEEKGLGRKTAIVTNDFHVFRGRMLARQAGLDACGIAAKCGISSRVCYVLRESCGLIYYLFFE